MGLDMYLHAEKDYYDYLTEQDPMLDLQKQMINKATGLKCHKLCNVRYQIWYWRKAYSIHNWFSRHTERDGWLAREDLEVLLDLCNQVKADKKLADELLPVEDGLEYDDDYFNDIQETIEAIDSILKDPTLSGCTFNYSASW